MKPTEITVVADSAADALRRARTLVGAGLPRLTSHVGGQALRERLADGERLQVLVVDLYMEVDTVSFLHGLRISGLDLGEAVVVGVTDDPEQARAAGVDIVIAPGNPEVFIDGVVEACERFHEARRRTLVAA